MRTVIGLFVGLVISTHLVAEGRKPRMAESLRLVPCQGCNTGTTLECQVPKVGQIKVDADGTTAWGYSGGNNEMALAGNMLAVFGSTVRADRVVVLALKNPSEKKFDLRYRDIREAKNQKRWLLLEDSGYRKVAPHAVWLLDLSKEKVATKMFDLFDPSLGGVSDPIHQLADDDGVGKMFFGPGHSGILVATLVGDHWNLYFSKIVAGSVIVKKLEWDDQDFPEDEPEWSDDDTCEFRFKDGRHKKFYFHQWR